MHLKFDSASGLRLSVTLPEKVAANDAAECLTCLDYFRSMVSAKLETSFEQNDPVKSGSVYPAGWNELDDQQLFHDRRAQVNVIMTRLDLGGQLDDGDMIDSTRFEMPVRLSALAGSTSRTRLHVDFKHGASAKVVGYGISVAAEKDDE